MLQPHGPLLGISPPRSAHEFCWSQMSFAILPSLTLHVHSLQSISGQEGRKCPQHMPLFPLLAKSFPFFSYQVHRQSDQQDPFCLWREPPANKKEGHIPVFTLLSPCCPPSLLPRGSCDSGRLTTCWRSHSIKQWDLSPGWVLAWFRWSTGRTWDGDSCVGGSWREGAQQEAGGSEGSRQGLKGRRRVERWAHQESRISLIPGRALAGEWHHREVLPWKKGALRVGWGVTSLGRQLLGAETPWEKEAAGSYYQSTHSSWQCWLVKGSGGTTPTSLVDLWPSSFWNFSREGWQGWGFFA